MTTGPINIEEALYDCDLYVNGAIYNLPAATVAALQAEAERKGLELNSDPLALADAIVNTYSDGTR